jgi:hypothetical protein
VTKQLLSSGCSWRSQFCVVHPQRQSSFNLQWLSSKALALKTCMWKTRKKVHISVLNCVLETTHFQRKNVTDVCKPWNQYRRTPTLPGTVLGTGTQILPYLPQCLQPK